ncbi:hypothetical protein [Azospirillum doebereinerae]
MPIFFPNSYRKLARKSYPAFPFDPAPAATWSNLRKIRFILRPARSLRFVDHRDRHRHRKRDLGDNGAIDGIEPMAQTFGVVRILVAMGHVPGRIPTH